MEEEEFYHLSYENDFADLNANEAGDYRDEDFDDFDVADGLCCDDGIEEIGPCYS